jgi:hypothetical protein
LRNHPTLLEVLNKDFDMGEFGCFRRNSFSSSLLTRRACSLKILNAKQETFFGVLSSDRTFYGGHQDYESQLGLFT